MPLKSLIKQFAPKSTILESWPLYGGISARMTAVTLQHPNGRFQTIVVRQPSTAVLARNPHAAAHEFRLLRLLHERRLPVPQPLHLGIVDETPTLLIEFLPGDMALAPHDPINYAEQLATQMARIHAIKSSNHDLSFLPAAPERCVERPFAPNAPFDTKRIWQAMQLALPKPHNAPALLHGDLWPGNTLWLDGQLTAVVDWEDAAVGDPLIDLAKTRSELSWILGQKALAHFTARYQALADIDYAQLPQWDLCAVLRFVRLASGDLAGMASFFVDYGRSDITATTIERDVSQFIDQALHQI